MYAGTRKGVQLSLQEYLEIKRRNQAKKELRKKYPSLMGQQLEAKVDQVLGIVDSGKMDWAILASNNVKTSKYPSHDSVKYDDFVKVAKEYKIRPYILYWFYMKKVNKLKASGRSKSDYYAMLKDIAPTVIGKELNFDTKTVAAALYAKDLKGVMLTRQQIEEMIIKGEL